MIFNVQRPKSSAPKLNDVDSLIILDVGSANEARDVAKAWAGDGCESLWASAVATELTDVTSPLILVAFNQR